MKEDAPVIRNDSPWSLLPLEDMLDRVDHIHRAITRAKGRVEYLNRSAFRGNSSIIPTCFGVERSRIEYAVLESDAECWRMERMKKELDELLTIIRPLIERLPEGVMRAVATQRLLGGVPCGLIARRMQMQRGQVYRLLDLAGRQMSRQYHQDIQKKAHHSPPPCP